MLRQIPDWKLCSQSASGRSVTAALGLAPRDRPRMEAARSIVMLAMMTTTSPAAAAAASVHRPRRGRMVSSSSSSSSATADRSHDGSPS
jgi:hypothetical protein